MKTLSITLMVLLPILTFGQDVYEVKFTAGYTQHRAALIIYENGTGMMRVKYHDPETKTSQLVEQYMQLENTQYGIRLTGYDPVYAGTSIRHSGYSTDNFYISQDEYGNFSIVNIDDLGVLAKAFIAPITGYYTRNNFLNDFKWKLD